VLLIPSASGLRGPGSNQNVFRIVLGSIAIDYEQLGSRIGTPQGWSATVRIAPCTNKTGECPELLAFTPFSPLA
jgi:hypothetical protein